MKQHSIFSFQYWSSSNRYIREKMKILKKIREYEALYKSFENDDFKAKTKELKERFFKGETLDDLISEAFALVIEASYRTLKMRHFDEQIIGGIALHEGNISEMKTGEGKTLVATLPSYLNALSGKGVHVITVNDYLAKRDCENLKPIYDLLGVQTKYLQSSMTSIERKEVYAADITYGTNSEFGFDYLRDNMRYNLNEMVTRRNYAILDEADSVLIDEARTPLIISGDAEFEGEESYEKSIKIISDIVKKLHSEKDYTLENRTKSVFLTEDGSKKVESELQKTTLLEDNSSLYESKNTNLVHYINQALKAHFIMKKNIDYIVRGRSITIIDEFTGRQMINRRFSEGLHSMLEAKENLRVQNETQSIASITLQNYFKLYDKLSGMTGTAKTEEIELQQVYGLNVIVIPTHKEMIRKDEDDEIYRTLEEKNFAIMEFLKSLYAKGQPVLLGTNSVEASDMYSKILKQHNIKHEVLNAKNHEKEAKIIANAGRFGRVTIATNMAGRGTDIKLGGDSKYIIQERFARGLNVTNEDVVKIESDIAENKQKVLNAGGLAVLGTERNESRRIDNQLRGRSGRQGDPGLSKFFICLEDNFMKSFDVDSLNVWLPRLGLKKNEAIKSSIVTSFIKKAQEKIESRNFSSRKVTLEYDNIMSEERYVVYSVRDMFLSKISVVDSIEKIMIDVSENITKQCFDSGELYRADLFEKLTKKAFKKSFDEIECEIKNIDLKCLDENGRLVEMTKQDNNSNKESKVKSIFQNDDSHVGLKTSDKNNIDFERSKDNENNLEKNIQHEDETTKTKVTADEFKRIINLFIKSRIQIMNDKIKENHHFDLYFKMLALKTIDKLWKQHLLATGHLKEVIYLRSYGQKDPLIEYKLESSKLFYDMMTNFEFETSYKASDFNE